jgi:mannosylglycerate hydrolase
MPTYHVIPHTHWDREWYLSFDHFRVLLTHLMDDLLDILATNPEYKSFTLDGQTSVLDDYLEIRPDRKELIEKYVREGRLLIGPWYILPDEHLVSGEATIRNLMRGRETAHAFGASMDVGYIPDSFGHIAQMPQILQGFGIDSAIVWRGFGGEPGQEPSEYRWIAPSGDHVLMEHLSDVGYSAAYFNSTDLQAAEERFEDFARRVDFRAQSDHRLMLCGGDHHWPYRELPKVLAHLNEKYKGDKVLVHSSITAFMEAMKQGVAGKTLPEVHGEMRFGYRWAFNVTGGVYSTRIYLKQANAAGQRLLERVLEPLDVITRYHKGRTQSHLIRQGWTYLMQNHPHDSICGCSIDPVHREMETRFEKLQELGKGVERFALMQIKPDREGDGGDDRQLLLFNPSPFDRDQVTEADVTFYHQKIVVGLNPDVVVDPPLPPVTGFTLVDAQGREVPYEIIDHSTDFGIAYHRFDYPSQTLVERFRVRFVSGMVPAMGFCALQIVRTDQPKALKAAAQGTGNRISNELITVEVNPDGSFMITDHTTNQTYGPLGYFEDNGDAGDEYNWSPPLNGDTIYDSRSSANISYHLIEGHYRRGIRVSGTWELPEGVTEDETRRSEARKTLHFETTAWLQTGERFVRFETKVDNTVKDHRFRAVFQTGADTHTHWADVQFGVIPREQQHYDIPDFKIEVPAAVAPMQRFVCVEDAQKKVCLIADGLPEYELRYNSQGTLLLTLLRCVAELGRGEIVMRPGGRGGWKNSTPDAQCLGVHRFDYVFMPRSASWSQEIAAINTVAETALLPLRSYRLKTDEVSSSAGYLKISNPAIVLSALKNAEDDRGVIMRWYNPSDQDQSAHVTLPGKHDVYTTNLEEQAPTALATQVDTLAIELAPYSIQTFLLT